MIWELLFKKPDKTINCNAARLYVGNYVSDTNQFGCMIDCYYEVISGSISIKRLLPVYVSDDSGLSKLAVIVVYPKSDVVELLVYGKEKIRVKLFKVEKGKHSRIFKQRL
jgi:hypothetical protein